MKPYPWHYHPNDDGDSSVRYSLNYGEGQGEPNAIVDDPGDASHPIELSGGYYAEWEQQRAYEEET